MSAATRTAGRLTKAFAVVLLAGVIATGCGESDASPSSTTASEDATATTTDATTNEVSTDDTSTDDTSTDEARPDGQDTVLGYQIAAEPGTVLDIEALTIAQGVEQAPLSQTATITDKPWQMLFTVFVDSAELTIEITEGDTATVEAIRGYLVDPEDPFGAIEVTETMDTVEVTAGTPVTLSVE